jgi:hypothetical protein
MWFVLGIVALLLSIGASLLARAQSAWIGPRHLCRDLETGIERAYELELLRHRRDYAGYRLGVRSVGGFDFAIRGETRFDRFARRFGVARDQTTGDAGFDARFYIESDDARVGRMLAQDASARDAIRALFACSGVHRLRAYGGRLWIETSAAAQRPVEASGCRQAARLHVLAQALTGVAGERDAARHEPFVARAALLLAVSSGLAVCAVMVLLRLNAGPSDVLDRWQMFRGMLWVALPLAAVMWVAAWRFMRASARAHRVLAELASVGLFGWIGCSFGVLHEANIAFDTSVRDWVQVDAVRVTRESHRCPLSRRHRRCYDYFVEGDWPAVARPASGRLEIDRASFRRLDGAKSVRIGMRAGRFGHAWVDGIERLD